MRLIYSDLKQKVTINFLLRCLSLIVMIGFLMACTTSVQIETTQPVVFVTKTQRWITPQQLAIELTNTPLILLGEKHDELPQHLAEQKLVELLIKHQKLKSVALEMFASTHQTNLTQGLQQIRQQRISDPQKIAMKLNWDSKWDWSQYQSLITYLALSSVNLYGANLNRDEINIIMQGAYPLNGQLSTTQIVKNKLKQIILGEHQIPAELSDKLVMAQQFKDRRMAETLIRNPQPILLIAGRFHVSKLVGVPLHLQDYQQQNYKVVILTNTKEDISPEEADYIWIVK